MGELRLFFGYHQVYWILEIVCQVQGQYEEVGQNMWAVGECGPVLKGWLIYDVKLNRFEGLVKYRWNGFERKCATLSS